MYITSRKISWKQFYFNPEIDFPDCRRILFCFLPNGKIKRIFGQNGSLWWVDCNVRPLCIGQKCIWSSFCFGPQFVSLLDSPFKQGKRKELLLSGFNSLASIFPPKILVDPGWTSSKLGFFLIISAPRKHPEVGFAFCYISWSRSK